MSDPIDDATVDGRAADAESRPATSGAGGPSDDARSVDDGHTADPGTPWGDEDLADDDELADDIVITVEDLVADLEVVAKERDDYLDALRRLQADTENYRKAVAKREADAKERSNEGLVIQLLPVLDACDGAVSNGTTDVEPVRASLLDVLTRMGLERIDDTDVTFDPEQHEAVMHEPSDDGTGPVVSQLLRVGYRWKGRVVRPAMVQVTG